VGRRDEVKENYRVKIEQAVKQTEWNMYCLASVLLGMMRILANIQGFMNAVLFQGGLVLTVL
jgi:hypothetical protein